MASKSPLKAEQLQETMQIGSPLYFYRQILKDIFASKYFSLEYIQKFLDIDITYHEKLNTYKSTEVQKKNNSKNVELDDIGRKKLETDIWVVFESVIKGPYNKPFQDGVYVNLKLLSDTYGSLKDPMVDYDIRKSPQNWALFKALYAAIFELTNQLYPNLIFVCSLIMDHMLKPDFMKHRNTLAAFRNSFQHKNEITNATELEIYINQVRNQLFNYTGKEIEAILSDGSKEFFLFNYHKTEVTLFTKINAGLLLKYLITSCHVISSIITRNPLIFSHELFSLQLSKYNFGTIKRVLTHHVFWDTNHEYQREDFLIVYVNLEKWKKIGLGDFDKYIPQR